MAIVKVVNDNKGTGVSSDAALRPNWGVERINFNNVERVNPRVVTSNTEIESRIIGNNGLTDSRIRLVGDWTFQNHTTFDTSAGARNRAANVFTDNVGDFIEITFTGTGINLLSETSIDGHTWNASVDGGAATNIHPFPAINTGNSEQLFGERGFSRPNNIIDVVNGLASGTHTVRITNATNASSTVMALYGIEILNEKASSSTNMDITAGDIYRDGYRYTSDAAETPTVIPAGTSARGARVITYINPLTQAVEQVFQDVDTASANFASANHANEEVIARKNFFDFGNHSFFQTATSTGNTTGFTLNDGTTALIVRGADVNAANSITTGGLFEPPSLVISGTVGDYISINFVGTGLDIFGVRGGGGSNFDFQVFVDGVSIGNLPDPGDSFVGILPIVSGLPYGSHSVRINSLTGTDINFGASEFLIYGPRRPAALPSKAVVIADYHRVANRVRTTSGVFDATSTGLIGKSPTKEMFYAPAGVGLATGGLDTSIYGAEAAIASNEYVEYTFFGTGIEVHGTTADAGDAPQIAITLDGTALGTTGTVTGVNGTYNSGTSRFTRTASTAVITKSILQITGLDLGTHTIRVTTNAAGTGEWEHLGFYVESPVHWQNEELSNANFGIGDGRDVFTEEGEQPIFFQQRVLGANAYSRIGDLTDMSFTNLEIGKTYRLSGHLDMRLDGDTNSLVRFNSMPRNQAGRTEYATAGIVITEPGGGAGVFAVNTIFKAVSDTLFFYSDNQGNGTDGVSGGSRIILEELPYHLETGKWL